ncbi:MAG: hypothetical protein HUU35_11535 [Armatimonadetes bacterium]|nr:hypothetical protein [Armatimonadota bacterium]
MTARRDWRLELTERLGALGHRNWILVADSAYPEQTDPGLELLVTGAEQTVVLQEVVDALATASHLQPKVYVDSELAYVRDAAAPGVEAFRIALAKLALAPTAVPHEELIGRVAAAAQGFTVLVLKTTSVLPYTTVFFELDCGYWDAAREEALRADVAQGSPRKP